MKKSRENASQKALLIGTAVLWSSLASAESLKEQLDSKRAQFNAVAEESVKKDYKLGLLDVIVQRTAVTAKQVGDRAPNFSLINAKGETVELQTALKDGPVILTWYRGGWCPYCNLTLIALQKELPNFQAAGAQLIALTPELPDRSLSTAEKHELEFEVLSDINSKVAKQFGIVFELTSAVAKRYDRVFGLSDYNGNDSYELPLSATYIINQQGVITYAFLDEDYRNRAEPAELTRQLNR